MASTRHPRFCHHHGLYTPPTCTYCLHAADLVGAATMELREVQARLDLALSRPPGKRGRR
jgi:hypothetical protein